MLKRYATETETEGVELKLFQAAEFENLCYYIKKVTALRNLN